MVWRLDIKETRNTFFRTRVFSVCSSAHKNTFIRKSNPVDRFLCSSCRTRPYCLYCTLLSVVFNYKLGSVKKENTPSVKIGISYVPNLPAGLLSSNCNFSQTSLLAFCVVFFTILSRRCRAWRGANASWLQRCVTVTRTTKR